MRCLKNIVSVSISFLLILAVACGAVSTYAQNRSGSYTGICDALTNEDKEWIIKHFGDCTDIVCLLNCIDDYCISNFEYDKEKTVIFQHFNFKDTISTNKGICFDFACFTKLCCLVWREYTNTSFEVYVVDVSIPKLDAAHSYNVVCMPDGTNYYIDTTSDITLSTKGEKPGGIEIFNTSIEIYASKYGEKIINYH